MLCNNRILSFESPNNRTGKGQKAKKNRQKQGENRSPYKNRAKWSPSYTYVHDINDITNVHEITNVHITNVHDINDKNET